MVCERRSSACTFEADGRENINQSPVTVLSPLCFPPSSQVIGPHKSASRSSVEMLHPAVAASSQASGAGCRSSGLACHDTSFWGLWMLLFWGATCVKPRVAGRGQNGRRKLKMQGSCKTGDVPGGGSSPFFLCPDTGAHPTEQIVVGNSVDILTIQESPRCHPVSPAARRLTCNLEDPRHLDPTRDLHRGTGSRSVQTKLGALSIRIRYKNATLEIKTHAWIGQYPARACRKSEMIVGAVLRVIPHCDLHARKIEFSTSTTTSTHSSHPNMSSFQP